MVILLNIIWFIVAFIFNGVLLDQFYQGVYRVTHFSEYLALDIFSSMMMLIPANIAHRKGRSFSLFAIYGILLWIVAIIHSIMMSSDKVKADPDKYKSCPYCGETVLKVATKCKHCHEQI
ncbi:hypothetical protein [Veillonella sp. 3627]|jgi:putative phage-related membrane protein|uniref:hypothetical protein n=1 Tax=Veillonella sp. 3627 TaxID=2490953 RepID=UPI000F8E5AB2|nr:hypothetical protein [Veillonella sp. 3627]